MQVDYIGDKVLCNGKQIDERLDEVRDHFGASRWINGVDVAEFLNITKSASSYAMISCAVRRRSDVVHKRTNKARLFAFQTR